jgi:D-alanyl-D-alanine endopeptidase (penicillin-binding protein 7)
MRTLLFWVFVGCFCVIARPTWAQPDKTDALPEVKSQSVIVIDAESGVEIFGKDADEIRPIASTTKIFVALAVRKKGIDLDAWTEITKVDAKQARGGAKTRLDLGERFRNVDLLRAMLMASDNRAPTALGRAVGWSPTELVKAMNDVAKALHLKRTKFTDTTGLRGNISTAREMAIALRAAIDDAVLREIMGDDYEEIIGKGGRPRIGYGTTNQPLVARTYDVIGGKTGYTTAAGYCYITAAKFAEKVVVMAFLGAARKQTRFSDFNRVAAWIKSGAPGAKLSLEAHARRAPPRLDTEVHGHVSAAK